MKKLSIWGDGTGCKDYIYIEDFCRILFILINMNYKNEIVNIGSGSVYSLNDIVETFHKQLPSKRRQLFWMGIYMLSPKRCSGFYIGYK